MTSSQDRTSDADWLQRFLDPARVRFLASAIIVVSLLLLAASFWTSNGGRTLGGAGPQLGNDFAGLYAAATFLNQSSAPALYDFERQDRLYHALFPNIPAEETLPYVHPPGIAALVRPLALLRYEVAFAIWLILSAALYISGILLLLRVAGLRQPPRLEVLLVLLSFEPFLMECWLNGQLSSIAFFAIALSVYSAWRGRCVVAGIALGICFYKPPLLLLLIPMLLLGRRWRMFAGLLGGGVAVGLIGLAGAGWANSVAFIDVLLGFTKTALGGCGLQLRLWKYVDLNSCLQLLLGGRGVYHCVLFGALAVVPLVLLIKAWSRPVDARDFESDRLTWAATLLWTPILNLYVGIYDTLVIVPGVLLLVGMFLQTRGAWSLTQRRLVLLLAAVYLAPWVSQPIARTVGIQLDSLVIAALGSFTLWVAARSSREVTNTTALTDERPIEFPVLAGASDGLRRDTVL